MLSRGPALLLAPLLLLCRGKTPLRRRDPGPWVCLGFSPSFPPKNSFTLFYLLPSFVYGCFPPPALPPTCSRRVAGVPLLRCAPAGGTHADPISWAHGTPPCTSIAPSVVCTTVTVSSPCSHACPQPPALSVGRCRVGGKNGKFLVAGAWVWERSWSLGLPKAPAAAPRRLCLPLVGGRETYGVKSR